MSDLKLAYLTCPQDGARGYTGALLITDARTRPLHFGYVSPVRPTTMQRILYGKTLDAHIKVDVISQRLHHDGRGFAPSVVFVDDQNLIPVRQFFGVPAAKLSKSSNGNGQAVQLSIYTFDTGGDAAGEERIGAIVAELEQSADLLNPFERMQEALKEALREGAK